MNVNRTQIIIHMMTGICTFLFSCRGDKPANLGVVKGELHPCPSSPNCVNTFEGDLQPLPYENKEKARKQLIGILKDNKRAKIITDSNNYIHTEYRTPIGGFIDDVEFLMDTAENKIHFRSASRLGYSDFGKNKRRMKKFMKKFNKKQ